MLGNLEARISATAGWRDLVTRAYRPSRNAPCVNPFKFLLSTIDFFSAFRLDHGRAPRARFGPLYGLLLRACQMVAPIRRRGARASSDAANGKPHARVRHGHCEPFCLSTNSSCHCRQRMCWRNLSSSLRVRSQNSPSLRAIVCFFPGIFADSSFG
jgi:hypothetical protein